MPKPPHPRSHPVIVYHHKHKSVAVLAMTGAILFISLVLAVTPLGASANAAAHAAYQASANAAAEAQNNPAPFPTPAQGTPLPATAPVAGQPGGSDNPRASGAHNFICTLLPWARYASSETTDAAGHPWRVSVILAQWAIEQGWKIPGYTGYNLGNVSAIAGYPSVGGIPVVGSPGRFAFGATLSQGMLEYLIFTHNAHLYEGVNAAYPAGADAQAYALGRSPWDAAHYNPGGGPGTSLVRVMQGNNLYRFDDPQVGC